MSDPEHVDVFIVDDNDDLLALSTRALQRAGFSAKGVANFHELDQLLETTQPRLILMDVQMPELFGDEVATALRVVRGVKATILLHSSLDAAVLDGLARNAGVDGYICKSDGLKALVDQVTKVLASAG